MTIKLLALPNDDIRKIILVALLLCLVCATLVSVAAVYLRPLQAANTELDRKKNILQAAGLMEPGIDVEQRFAERIQARMVDLRAGSFSDAVAPAGFDQRAASRDPAISQAVPEDRDIARIRRQSQFAPVYLVLDEQQQLQQMVIPVHGYGLWSTMYGFVALGSGRPCMGSLRWRPMGERPRR
jgi:Na+-transporting NADH:ubiquinone oxidoreductase subunit C